jgi:hypothetical protein
MGAILKIRGEDGKVYEIPALGGGLQIKYLCNLASENPVIPSTCKGLLYKVIRNGDWGMLMGIVRSGIIWSNGFEGGYQTELYFDFSEMDLMELGFVGMAGDTNRLYLVFDWEGKCEYNPFPNIASANDNPSLSVELYVIE